jgi:hypothetical protein
VADVGRGDLHQARHVLGLTPCAASVPVMPTLALSARSQGTKAAPPPATLQTWASSSNFAGTAS